MHKSPSHWRNLNGLTLLAYVNDIALKALRTVACRSDHGLLRVS